MKNNEFEDSIKAIAVYVKKELEQINSRLNNIERSHGSVSEFNNDQIRDYAKRIKILEDSNDSMRKSIDSKMVILEDRLRKSSPVQYATDDKRINNVEGKVRELENSKSSIEEANVKIISLEKKMQDIMAKLNENHAAKAYAIHDEYAKDADSRSMSKEISDIKRSVEELSVNVINNDKKIEDMKNVFGKINTKENVLDVHKKLSEIDSAMSTAKKLEKIDFEKLRQELAQYDRAVKNLESNVEVITTKFLTKELNDFAKAMDRKIPALVTKEEMYKEINLLGHKMRGIAEPDVAKLERKIDLLERSLSEISNLMRGMTGRMPVIVE